MLQIQHQVPQVQASQTGPTQNPLLFLAKQQTHSTPPTTTFASSSIYNTSPTMPPQPASVGVQHGPWQQTLETNTTTTSSCCSTSSFSSSMSPVASAAYLLEAHLHISQQPHPHLIFQQQKQQQQAQSAAQATFPILSKPSVWSLSADSSAAPNMQELVMAGQQQQLSSCVMVK